MAIDIARLTEFLSARLTEDEAVARRNIGGGPGWQHGLGDTEGSVPVWPDYQTYDSEELDAAEAYLKHFRPLRMLREVAAKRALIGEILTLDSWTEQEFLLRRAADTWSDHQDYAPEWAALRD